MKTHKYLWIALCSALLLFVACQKPTILTINTKGVFSFGPEGGKGSFTFVCNKAWRITSDSWIHVSPSSGSGADGDISISFTCDANNTYDFRSGAISIDAEDCRTSAIVEQSAESTIIVSPTSFVLTSDEQEFEISVQTNLKQWRYWIEASNTWLSPKPVITQLTQEKGLTRYKMVYTITENKTGNNRKDNIYFALPTREVLAIVSVEQQTAPIPVEALLVDYTSFTMTEGQSTRIVVTIKPNNATDKTLTWSTSDATVATVDDEGRVNALKPGTAIITAAAGGQSVSITVTVVPKTIAVTSISLDKTNLEMTEGESEILTATVKPDDATDKTVSWSSSNSAVASVDNNGTVTAIKEGSAIITAKAGSKSATCSVTVSPNGAIAIDLGLSVKWASCNLGANKPEDYGDYYAWGETVTKDQYYWGNYKWCNGSSTTLTKYNTNSSYGYVDNKTTLDSADDVVRVKLGGTWRMPSDDDWKDLLTQCTWTESTLNGVKGRLVTGKNGNSIFLPAAGRYSDAGLDDTGRYGMFWSSSISSTSPHVGHSVYYITDDIRLDGFQRFYGLSVRPVTE